MATSGVIKVGDSADVADHILSLINSGYYVKIGNFTYYYKNGTIQNLSNQYKQINFICIDNILFKIGYLYSTVKELKWELVCPFSNALNSMKKIRIDYDKTKREVDDYYETVQSVVNFDEIELVNLIFEYVY